MYSTVSITVHVYLCSPSGPERAAATEAAAMATAMAIGGE